MTLGDQSRFQHRLNGSLSAHNAHTSILNNTVLPNQSEPPECSKSNAERMSLGTVMKTKASANEGGATNGVPLRPSIPMVIRELIGQ